MPGAWCRSWPGELETLLNKLVKPSQGPNRSLTPFSLTARVQQYRTQHKDQWPPQLPQTNPNQKSSQHLRCKLQHWKCCFCIFKALGDQEELC